MFALHPLIWFSTSPPMLQLRWIWRGRHHLTMYLVSWVWNDTASGVLYQARPHHVWARPSAAHGPPAARCSRHLYRKLPRTGTLEKQAACSRLGSHCSSVKGMNWYQEKFRDMTTAGCSLQSVYSDHIVLVGAFFGRTCIIVQPLITPGPLAGAIDLIPFACQRV